MHVQPKTRQVARHLGEIVGALGLGSLLFYISNFYAYTPVGYPPSEIAFGLPLFWNLSGGGASVNLTGTAPTCWSACSLISQLQDPHFIIDIVFWLAFSLIAVEVCARVATRRLGKKIEVNASLSEERVSP